ncbi:EF-hand domain-containing protein [Streptomyces sp. NBC_01525]|uniref:EF-hand domain-containing protein n=1 Tax=Streptomyces benahoarensis TaxID=2595054 RepID=A0A553ZLV2_9ACTN|nr:EF-hand domain-containing protein [Streptomyces benahoarensis]TSB23356.1 EF-hand domain-containing protein [Streptomyces benahoarensis]TSB42365.1 EF-hand domain-containing protein [Streptomyces benahoarensis]
MSNKALQQDRLRQRFALYDTNGDGRIGRADLENEARRIVEAFGESVDAPRAQALLTAYPQLFDFLSKQVGAEGELTQDQFLEAAEKEVISAGPEGFGRVLRPSIRAMVDLADTDGDGQVSPAEFEKWLKAISADINADTAFQAVDADGNGQLSVDELVLAVGRYHSGELDAPLLGI